MTSAGRWTGLLAFTCMLLLPAPASMAEPAWRVAAVAALMAIWWFSEAVPTPITALLPFLLLPVLGGADPAEVAQSYMSPIIFLLLGSALLAAAVEKVGLHRHIAVRLARRASSSPDAILLAMMAATAVVAVFASDTATVMVMMPVAASTIAAVARSSGVSDDDPRVAVYAKAFVIGLAYAAALGGFALLIASPSNAVAAGLIERFAGIEVSFVTWAAFGLPVTLIGVPLAWAILVKLTFRHGLPAASTGGSAAAFEAPHLDGASRRVSAVLVAAMIAWLAMPLIEDRLPRASDAAVAVLAGLSLFLIPTAGRGSARLLEWKDTSGVPWGVLLLVGGGLALADGLTATGLSGWAGAQFARFADWPAPVLLLVGVAIVVVVTEFASNIATTAFAVPAFIALAAASGGDPLSYGMIAALAAKWAFAVPAGAPWLAVALASPYVRMRDMIRVGVWMDLVGVGLLIGIGLLAIRVVQ